MEKEITDKFAVGDVNAMDLLYDHYADTLYGLAMRMVRDESQAQDIIQEAFVKVWIQSKSYDASKGRLFTWLLCIVRNHSIDNIRTVKRRGEIYNNFRYTFPERSVADNEEPGLTHDMRIVLSHLDDHQKQLVEHSYIFGYSHAEIAEKFDIPLGTVKTRLRKAMFLLRTIFGNDSPNSITSGLPQEYISGSASG